MDKETKKQEIAQLLVAYKDSGGTGLEKTIDKILETVEDKKDIQLETSEEKIIPIKNYRDAVEHIMQNTNFHKIQSAMTHLSWTWAGSSGCQVPTIAELENCVRRLFDDVKNGGSIATGGFEVAYNKKHETMSVKFVLEGWDYWDE